MRRSIMLPVILSAVLWAQPRDTQSYRTLEKVKPYAIELGVGATEVYVFVDPMCPKSRAYITHISTTGNLLRRLHYYIFLQRLEKFDSDRLIHEIYASKNPRLMLQKVMVEGCAPQELKGVKHAYADRAVAAVSEAAERIGMKRRPYLMILKPDAPYCVVSEGDADCLPPKPKP